jgi:hypothetical protein
VLVVLVVVVVVVVAARAPQVPALHRLAAGLAGPVSVPTRRSIARIASDGPALCANLALRKRWRNLDKRRA